MRWLDTGCGNGAFTEEIIARRAPAELTAIDPSEEQLAYAAAELTRVVRRGGGWRPTCGIFRAEDRLCIPLTRRSSHWAGTPRFRPIPWFQGAKRCESCGKGPG
jgi:hypothetical protein